MRVHSKDIKTINDKAKRQKKKKQKLMSSHDSPARAARISVNIRKFYLRDHIIPEVPFNALVVGPSNSRKNACIQNLIDAARPRAEKLVIVTEFPEFYNEKTFDSHKFLPGAFRRAECRVFEDSGEFGQEIFRYFENNPVCTTIVSCKDYPKQLPRSSAAALDYVFFFGGVQQIRRAWDDFGALIPKLRDFRQIYLACTGEGDRYSDEFMVIKNEADTKDPNRVLFWASLTKKHLENISTTIETSVVLNNVKTARHVELPKPKAHYVEDEVEEAVAALPSDDYHRVDEDRVDEDRVDEDAQERGGGDGDEVEDGERDERGECLLM